MATPQKPKKESGLFIYGLDFIHSAMSTARDCSAEQHRVAAQAAWNYADHVDGWPIPDTDIYASYWKQ